MKAALVTGASGFIGATLCRALADRGIRVHAVLRGAAGGLFAVLGLADCPNVRIVHATEVTAEVVRESGVDAVFHLAGLSQVEEARADPARAFEVNARGTWTLLDTIHASGLAPRVVVTSTDAVYGEAPGRPSVETDPLLGRGPYELSKMAAEAAAFAFADAGLPATIARLGNVYGCGDVNRGRLVPGAVAAVRAGCRPELRTTGSVRSYLHVDDCAAGLIALAGAPAAVGRAVNVASETRISNIDLVRLILAVAGRPDLEPVVLGKAGKDFIRFSSSALAREITGWRETIPLEQGIVRTLELQVHGKG